MTKKEILYFLSSLDSVKVEELLPYLERAKKVGYLYGDIQKVVEFFLRSFNERGVFPSWDECISFFDLGDDKSFPEFNYDPQSRFLSLLNLFEVEFLEKKLVSTNDQNEKRELLKSLSAKLDSVSSVVDLEESAEIDVSSVGSRKLEDGVVFNIQAINDSAGTLAGGNTVAVVGIPGAGKTTFVLNIVFLNSVVKDYNCIYFYGEDIKQNYFYRLLSRYSFFSGDRVPAKALISGLQEEDDKEKFKELHDKYASEKKGNIYFVPFKDLPNEPLKMASYVGQLFDKYDVDYFVVDHLQKWEVFKPPSYPLIEYLNRMSSTFASLALGDFSNRPVVAFLLSQLSREGEKAAVKTKGRINLNYSANISKLEQDAFVYIHVYTDDALKEAGEFFYQLLKVRNGETFENPQVCYADFSLYFMGDVETLDAVYNVESLDSLSLVLQDGGVSGIDASLFD